MVSVSFSLSCGDGRGAEAKNKRLQKIKDIKAQEKAKKAAEAKAIQDKKAAKAKEVKDKKAAKMQAKKEAKLKLKIAKGWAKVKEAQDKDRQALIKEISQNLLDKIDPIISSAKKAIKENDKANKKAKKSKKK